MPTLIGERKMQLAVSANDNGGFMVGTVDMQVPDGTPFDATKAIEGARDGLVKAVAGDVQPVESDIEMKGLKGKEFKFEAVGKGPGGSDVQGVARVLIDEKGGKRVFTLVAVGKKPLDEKAVAQFFDSFETKEPGAAAAVDAGAGAAAGEPSPTCKKFLDAYTACVDKMPEAARPRQGRPEADAGRVEQGARRGHDRLGLQAGAGRRRGRHGRRVPRREVGVTPPRARAARCA